MGASVCASAPDFTHTIQTELNKLKISNIHIPLSRTGLNIYKDLIYIKKLRHHLLVNKINFFIGYTAKPVIYGLIAATLAKVPNRFVMITGAGFAFGSHSLKQRLVGYIIKTLYYLSLRQARIVFFQNHDDLMMFVNNGLIKQKNTYLVNGSGVELDHFPHTSLLPGPVVFLMVARLLKAKGVLEYLKAATIASNKLSDSKWLLVGPFDDGNPDGIGKTEFEKMLQDSPVEHIGWSDNIISYLQSCHIFVLPSYREGLPRSVLEAMAVGRPILTTDVPGCRETVIEGVNGMLVPSMNKVALADAMVTMASDIPALSCMGAKSRQIAEEKFDANQISRLMADAMGLTNTG